VYSALPLSPKVKLCLSEALSPIRKFLVLSTLLSHDVKCYRLKPRPHQLTVNTPLQVDDAERPRSFTICLTWNGAAGTAVPVV